MLAPDWHPDRVTESNGAVCPPWAVPWGRCAPPPLFPDALRAAIDVGGDTDTVTAVTGALAGVVYGLEGVPQTWQVALRVPVPG